MSIPGEKGGMTNHVLSLLLLGALVFPFSLIFPVSQGLSPFLHSYLAPESSQTGLLVRVHAPLAKNQFCYSSMLAELDGGEGYSCRQIILR